MKEHPKCPRCGMTMWLHTGDGEPDYYRCPDAHFYDVNMNELPKVESCT